MIQSLEQLLQTRAGLVSYVTQEDDRLLRDLEKYLKRAKAKKTSVQVYNSVFGLKPLEQYVLEWGSVVGPGPGPHDIVGALNQVYLDKSAGHSIYVFLDGGPLLQEYQVVRRVQNILEQGRQNDKLAKTLIFTGTKKVVPEKLSRAVHVVVDRGPTEEEIRSEIPSKLFPEVSEEAVQALRGLTMGEVSHILQVSYLETKGSGMAQLDPKRIRDFKRSRVSSDLLTVAYSDTGFDRLGGANNFKDWVHRVKPAWTPEGLAYGLTPPKGVLLLGVYGCGKSLAVKTMAHEWGLPLVTFDLSRVRSSGVGDSESNLHTVLFAIEALAPCVVHLDEAEKSLSGLDSSAQSDSGVTARLLGMFSTWLQETKADICLALTSNTLQGLPAEVVNRMSERFFFDLPSAEVREEIVRIHVESRGHSFDSYQELATASDRLVGREIEQSVEATLLRSFQEKSNVLLFDALKEELECRPRLADTLDEEIRMLSSWCTGVGRPRARRA